MWIVGFQKQLRAAPIIVLAVVLLIPLAGVAEDTVHFAYKFTPEYSQQFKCEFSQEQDFYGMNYVVLVEMEITEKCVEALGDTIYKMEVTFDKISSSIRMNDNLMPNPMDDALREQTIGYQVNKAGEVTEIKAKSYITGWSQISQMVNQVLSAWYPHLPDSTIKAGEKWDIDTIEHPEEAQGMEVNLKATYEFKEVKKEKGRSCAKVAGKSNSIMKGEVVNNFGRFDMDGTMKAEFEFYFDPGGYGIVKFKSKGVMDAEMIEKTGSSAKKPEEKETHMSYEVKKEIK